MLAAPLRARPAAVAPFSHLGDEVRRIALTRALRVLPPALLVDPATRSRAYAAAGLTALSGADDVEAQRRAILFNRCVAPAPILGAAA